jgi:hypothetical protein
LSLLKIENSWVRLVCTPALLNILYICVWLFSQRILRDHRRKGKLSSFPSATKSTHKLPQCQEGNTVGYCTLVYNIISKTGSSVRTGQCCGAGAARSRSWSRYTEVSAPSSGSRLRIKLN